jgi:hypothetical protein
VTLAVFLVIHLLFSNLIVPLENATKSRYQQGRMGAKRVSHPLRDICALALLTAARFLTQNFPKGLGDNPFIRMVRAPLLSPSYLPLTLALHSPSPNKNSDANAEPAPVPSPSSAGTRAPACVSKRQSSAKLAQRHATSARRVSSTSNTICRRRYAIRRWESRMRRRRAISIGSTMRRTRRPRCVRFCELVGCAVF